jgi:hypothetical protein
LNTSSISERYLSLSTNSCSAVSSVLLFLQFIYVGMSPNNEMYRGIHDHRIQIKPRDLVSTSKSISRVRTRLPSCPNRIPSLVIAVIYGLTTITILCFLVSRNLPETRDIAFKSGRSIREATEQHAKSVHAGRGNNSSHTRVRFDNQRIVSERIGVSVKNHQ